MSYNGDEYWNFLHEESAKEFDDYFEETVMRVLRGEKPPEKNKVLSLIPTEKPQYTNRKNEFAIAKFKAALEKFSKKNNGKTTDIIS